MIRNDFPPEGLRRGPNEWLNNDSYLRSAIYEVRRIEPHVGLNTDSNVLDVGCSTGKLLIGIKNSIGKVNHYHGVDVDRKHIEWADKALSTDKYKFTYLDLHNDRYNKGGKLIDDSFRFPTKRKFDLIYLYSVFTHMIPSEISIYLREFRKLLAVNGTVVLTVLIDDKVDYVELNNCIRYSQKLIESLFSDFTIKRFEYQTVEDYQSIYYLQ